MRTSTHYPIFVITVYPKKYAHGFCFAVLCCGYTLTDFPISIRLTSLALWQSNDCPSASKATLMNIDKYFMWIHYERLRNQNKAKHNKTVCIFLGIYCIYNSKLGRVILMVGIQMRKRPWYNLPLASLRHCITINLKNIPSDRSDVFQTIMHICSVKSVFKNFMFFSNPAYVM